ncbi:MAG: hypothetical protein EBX36_07450, partial [Planctomycetia bacterium]|nr:hypothetical protein [Planctomycetia bacterium]
MARRRPPGAALPRARSCEPHGGNRRSSGRTRSSCAFTPLAYDTQPVDFLLYTRRGCHLCAEAEDLLACAGVPVECIDVDADRAVAAR